MFWPHTVHLHTIFSRARFVAFPVLLSPLDVVLVIVLYRILLEL